MLHCDLNSITIDCCTLVDLENMANERMNWIIKEIKIFELKNVSGLCEMLCNSLTSIFQWNQFKVNRQMKEDQKSR